MLFHHYFTTTNLLRILRKKLNFLIPFFKAMFLDQKWQQTPSVTSKFVKIIQNLNPKKANDHNKISIRMLKICGNSLRSPLEFIFNNCLANEIFLSDWKKDNIVPVYKKNDIQRLNNCRPISLLTICSKILEQLIFNEMFRFFIKNDLISQHQSGFKLRDSCINQPLSITHEIYHLMKVLMPIVYFST